MNSVVSNLRAAGLKGYQVNVANGFWENQRNKAEMYALMHSELDEAFLAVDEGCMDDKLPEYPGDIAEIADTVIRIADYAEGFGLKVWECIDTLVGPQPKDTFDFTIGIDKIGRMATQKLAVGSGMEYYESLLFAHSALSLALECLRKPEKYPAIKVDGVEYEAETFYLAATVLMCMDYVDVQYDFTTYLADDMSPVDLLVMVMEKKIAVNATRGYKHGKQF